MDKIIDMITSLVEENVDVEVRTERAALSTLSQVIVINPGIYFGIDIYAKKDNNSVHADFLPKNIIDNLGIIAKSYNIGDPKFPDNLLNDIKEFVKNEYMPERN